MLLDRHRAKIVSTEVLETRIRDARLDRADRRVVMCHGVFDVVHPGHVRHLLYAKSKADVLVCSITPDEAVKKGPYRPHTPQQIRAANLAVFDIVDYVVICDAAGTLDLISRVKPDFYAKGFEYSLAAGRTRPIPEAAVVEGYGGEVLYTPGDFVRSSSALIEAGAPDLRWDKLALVMERRKITFDSLRCAVAGLRGLRAHVVGDTIVDALIHCEMIGANAKTPTISVRRERREEFVGGAAIVALHMQAAGAMVTFSTVLGDDAAGVMVADNLSRAGVDVRHLADRARPTTVKEAVVVDGYRMLKIDTVDNRSISDAILRRLCEQVAETEEESAVVFSDFRHGVFNARTIPQLTAAAPGRCMRAADSQVASRWGNIADFKGFHLVTPNEKEARHALADQDSGVRPLAARLREEIAAKWLLMKMGARGVLGFSAEGDSFALDAFAREVRDPVGAGDAFLAYAVLGLISATGCLATAAILGSLAAGIECEYDGNVPVTPDAVLARIDDAEKYCG